MRFGRSPSGILACLPLGEKRGLKSRAFENRRKADRDAPCDQARMLDSVRSEVLHDAKPTNERRLALGLRPKPHFYKLIGLSTSCKEQVFACSFFFNPPPTPRRTARRFVSHACTNGITCSFYLPYFILLLLFQGLCRYDIHGRHFRRTHPV